MEGTTSYKSEKERTSCKEYLSNKKENIGNSIKFIIDNDELWNIGIFIVIFLVMLLLSKFNIYGVRDSVMYSFSLASLFLSISQVTPLGVSRIFNLLGYLVLILGGDINIEYINILKVIVDDKSLLILSMIVVFLGFLVNKFKVMEAINTEKAKVQRISTYLNLIENFHNYDKREMIEYAKELKMLIELSDIELTEKVFKAQEIIRYMETNSTFEPNMRGLKSSIIKEVSKTSYK